jgi:protein TonB
MTRSLLLVLGLVFGICSFAQVDKQDSLDRVYEISVMPEFPGGEAALAAFIKKEVKYPKKAKRAGIQGKVLVSFVVDKDGSVTDVSIARGMDPLLDEEAMRAVRLMPKWTPGLLNGKPVKTKFNLPVSFVLKD